MKAYEVFSEILDKLKKTKTQKQFYLFCGFTSIHYSPISLASFVESIHNFSDCSPLHMFVPAYVYT